MRLIIVAISYGFYSEVRNAAMKVAEKLFQEVHTAIPDIRCSVCTEECGSYAGLSKSINRLHAEHTSDVNSVEGYTRQLNNLLLIKRITDVVIKEMEMGPHSALS